MLRLAMTVCLCLGLAATLAFAPALADQPAGTPAGNWMMSNPTPTGRWITSNHDAVIQITRCGNDLCGQIVGIALKPGEPVPKDWRGTSQCGLTIIRTSPAAAGAWAGSILDPRDGSVYNARIRLDAAHNLRLRGFLGLPVLGQTQTWTPYRGGIEASCRLPGAS